MRAAMHAATNARDCKELGFPIEAVVNAADIVNLLSVGNMKGLNT